MSIFRKLLRRKQISDAEFFVAFGVMIVAIFAVRELINYIVGIIL